jgi:hypothetical protein
MNIIGTSSAKNGECGRGGAFEQNVHLLSTTKSQKSTNRIIDAGGALNYGC